MCKGLRSAGGFMINKNYLAAETIEKIKQEFLSKDDFPSTVLFKFLEREFYMKLRQQIIRLYYKKEVVRVSHSYAAANLPPAISKWFNQKEFLDFLSSILNKKVQLLDARAYTFSWKDYTVLSDTTVEKPGFDFIFDFTHDWDERGNGYIFYKDEEGNFISLPLAADMLAIVERKAGVQKYVQYVNHYAQKNRRYMVMGKMIF